MRNPPKRRIIINDYTDLPSTDVLAMVGLVIDGGDVSETNGVKHPCSCTTWKRGPMVLCRPTKGGALAFTVDMQGAA